MVTKGLDFNNVSLVGVFNRRNVKISRFFLERAIN